jgi:hypothetical protein
MIPEKRVEDRLAAAESILHQQDSEVENFAVVVDLEIES